MSDNWWVGQTGGQLPGQKLSQTLWFFHNLTEALQDFKEKRKWIDFKISVSHMKYKLLAPVDTLPFFFCSDQKKGKVNYCT